MRFDYAVHSDFLIHWTGKDIDEQTNPRWIEEPSSKTCQCATSVYLDRLKDILLYGLWVTDEPEYEQGGLTLPTTANCCFTELRVSQSRLHAQQYGRLGIGVKRLFVTHRGGRPVSYFDFNREGEADAVLATLYQSAEGDSFLKPMHRSTKKDYSFYAESEWRISANDAMKHVAWFTDPNDSNNAPENRYYNGLAPESRNKLRYLLPLTGWFAMIIYPSLAVKIAAFEDEEIRSLIPWVKDRDDDTKGNRESENMPIELDLDACRNF